MRTKRILSTSACVPRSKPTYPYVSWGTSFFDMDNDGWLDLFIANGHVYPEVDTIPGGTPYREPMLLFRNHHDGTFDDVSQALATMPRQSRRGASFGDINNDGNIDIVVLNVGEPPSLLLNHSESANHRVLFKLVGTKSNKSAIGARVTVKAAVWCSSMKCAAVPAIFRRMICGCTLVWRRTTR